MTAAPIPGPPTPAHAAAASERLHASRRLLAAVPEPTRAPVELPRPRELRTAPGVEESPALTAARVRHAECSRGAHVWAPIPDGPAVCLHCPVRADQADRIRAHRLALAVARVPSC